MSEGRHMYCIFFFAHIFDIPFGQSTETLRNPGQREAQRVVFHGCPCFSPQPTHPMVKEAGTISESPGIRRRHPIRHREWCPAGRRETTQAGKNPFRDSPSRVSNRWQPESALHKLQAVHQYARPAWVTRLPMTIVGRSRKNGWKAFGRPSITCV